MHHTNPLRRTHDTQQEPSRFNHDEASQSFQAPVGPPPGRHPVIQNDDQENYAAPPGPPPSHKVSEPEDEQLSPPPYDPWMQVPDNSTLPPPPSIGYDTSPTANASIDSSERARIWCQANRLFPSRNLSASEVTTINQGDISLLKAPTLPVTISSTRPGSYRVKSKRGCEDSILLTNLPLFSARYHDVHTHGPRAIYFEIRVLRMGGDNSSFSEADAGIAIGFVAPPYPAWRLPGWERSSLGVHGDDGRRYMDDNSGGKDFTTAFQNGEVVGIGLTLSPHRWQQGAVSVEAFFTREGRKAGTWDVNEEQDAEEHKELSGLQGKHDILGAIGFFGSVDFEVRFRRDEWMFRP